VGEVNNNNVNLKDKVVGEVNDLKILEVVQIDNLNDLKMV